MTLKLTKILWNLVFYDLHRFWYTMCPIYHVKRSKSDQTDWKWVKIDQNIKIMWKYRSKSGFMISKLIEILGNLVFWWFQSILICSMSYLLRKTIKIRSKWFKMTQNDSKSQNYVKISFKKWFYDIKMD